MDAPAAVGIGFVGLGNIGRPLAERLAATGCALGVYDSRAGVAAPAGAVVAASVGELARNAGVIFLCLPSFAICKAVLGEIIASGHGDRIIVDTSTIGPSGAAALAEQVANAGGSYLDAPISGGVHRAYEGKLTSMVAGRVEIIEQARPLLAAYSSQIRVVGERPGQAQAMKLVNNYASIVAMLGASEAISYGLSQGLVLADMLAVMNASSGQSFATDTLFPRHIVSGAFDSAAPARIVGKDLGLFVSEATRSDTMHRIGDVALSMFDAFARQDDDRDWLRVFEFIRDGGGTTED